MYRWLSLLVLVFLITGVSASDEIPDITNETAIDPESEDEGDDDSVDIEIIVAAIVLGLSIVTAAVILKK
jgi:hypothetical protein